MTALQADAFILAAGFGKRLGELTRQRPKPLIEIHGQALIDRHVLCLAKHGFRRIIVNLHYLGEQIEAHLARTHPQLEFVFSYEPTILDTGGGVRNIEQHLRHEHLITLNADSFFGDDVSLASLLKTHQEAPKTALATLMLQKRNDAKAFGELGRAPSGRISSFLGATVSGETFELGYMYVGAQVISRRLFDLMPAAGSVFSLTKDLYLPLIQQDEVLWSALYTGFFSDVGTPERLAEAKKFKKSS